MIVRRIKEADDDRATMTMDTMMRILLFMGN